MTKREMYVAIMEGTVAHEDLVAFCEKEIEALDHKALKAKERAAAKRAETDELKAVVLEALTDELATREEIAARIDGADVTVGKVGSRLSALIREGKAIKEKVKVTDEDGKASEKMAYRLA